ncbi:tegument protein UL37 [Spheniscid alphaherpesvirus 1]|uniref:Tegument protein UL37 n=1 Tax=Spheniscid alphaherpesvirus 1 TaxID=2560777 RepID=A0A1R3TAW6_9ALPH|nr:tegument protein UL37 [Spheniscid alphaherpesvirus 1]SCO83527.1 tegument protein UL37 [Spheniscid alphaherpesvirus 1]
MAQTSYYYDGHNLDRWPLYDLVNALKNIERDLLTRNEDQQEDREWPSSSISEARAAISAFCFSSETMTTTQVAKTWYEAHRLLCDMYVATKSPEAALLAENFIGLVLWRVRISWSRTTALSDADVLLSLVESMTDASVVDMITSSGLRASATFGPNLLRGILIDWITTFKKIVMGVSSFSAVKMFDNPESIPASSFTAHLTVPTFTLIYDMPFVQDGLRLVAESVNWTIQYRMLADRCRDKSLTPLTRVLFTLALVDEYFTDCELSRQLPKSLVTAFREDVDALGEAELMSPDEANSTQRTASEVRVSAAIAYRDPLVREIQPGMAAVRIRTDPSMFSPGGPLTDEALAVHTAAVVRLISLPASVDAHTDQVVQSAKARLAESARATWDTVHSSSAPHMVLSALITSGFVPKNCRMYERVLSTSFTRSCSEQHIADSITNNTSVHTVQFDDVQQTVGCLATLGSAVHTLTEYYGPGSDYIEKYTNAVETVGKDRGVFFASLGLPEGGIEQVLRHCMAPKPLTDYIKAERDALLTEIDTSDKINSSSGQIRRHGNAAREALLTWFDLRAKETWGLDVPSGTYRDQVSSADAVANIDSRRFTEATFIITAASIRYPETVSVQHDILSAPAFAPYIVSTAVADALSVATSTVFTSAGLKAAIDVIQWARNYGASIVPNVDGYRTKLTALLLALTPFTSLSSPPPKTSDAENIEALLGELHAAVTMAMSTLPKEIGMVPPAKPAVANSVLLASLHGTALRRRLETLIEKTAVFAETVTSNAKTALELVKVLQRFFSCRFKTIGETGQLLVVSGKSSRNSFGTWRLVDVIDAISSVCGECADKRIEIRAADMSLREVMAETTAQLKACETLYAQTGDDSRAAFGAMASDYAKLSHLQTTIVIRTGKLLSGQEMPALRHVSRFLARWTKVNTSYRNALKGDSPEALLSLATSLRSVWDELETERASVPNIALTNSNRDLSDAVGTLLEKYPPIDSESFAPVTLSSKCNIANWSDNDFATLERGVIPPTVPNPAEYADDFLCKERVFPEDLLAVVDAIFQNNH